MQSNSASRRPSVEKHNNISINVICGSRKSSCVLVAACGVRRADSAAKTIGTFICSQSIIRSSSKFITQCPERVASLIEIAQPIMAEAEAIEKTKQKCHLAKTVLQIRRHSNEIMLAYAHRVIKTSTNAGARPTLTARRK